MKLPVAPAFGIERVRGSRRRCNMFALSLLTRGARILTDSHVDSRRKAGDDGTGLLLLCV